MSYQRIATRLVEILRTPPHRKDRLLAELLADVHRMHDEHLVVPQVSASSRNITDRIRRVFLENPDRAMSIDDVHEFMPDVRRHTVNGTVSRLARGGDTVVRVDRGLYRLRPELASREGS